MAKLSASSVAAELDYASAALGMCMIIAWLILLRACWMNSRGRIGFDVSREEEDDGPSQMHTVGLDRESMDALPMFEYKSENFKEGLQCAVCLSEFEENEKGRLLPNCNHRFHTECIDMWFFSHSSCPLCRTRVQPLVSVNAENSLEISTNNPLIDESSGERNASVFYGHTVRGQTGLSAVQYQTPADVYLCVTHDEMDPGISSQSAMDSSVN